jgi:short-subunit dehydrogenase
MSIDLKGKPIAITGASSGIGLATAVACARAGMPVVLAARRLDKLHAGVAMIRAAGGSAIAVACDVEKPADCDALIERTVAEFGSIYSVFANAGYGIESGVLETPDVAIRAIFETNFYGTLHTIRPAIARMTQAGKGHVLICSSCVSKLGIPKLSAYSATKAAQDHVGRALRVELLGSGIRVSTVHPIGTSTEFGSSMRAKSGSDDLFKRTPSMFMQTPETVASAVVRCLRRPRGEVWTSLPTRLFAGVCVAFPGVADMVLRAKFKERG